jgi:putative membrane protein
VERGLPDDDAPTPFRSIDMQRHPLLVATFCALASAVALAQTAPQDQTGTAGNTGTQGTGGSPGKPAWAPDSNAMNRPDVPDADFVRMASAAGMAEVTLGKIGSEKGQSAAVKQFGQQMVTDHTSANEKLAAIASQKGAAVSAEPMTPDRNAAARIQNLSGAEFDKAFSERMVMDHKKVIAMFEKEAKSGKDPDIKAFATQTLPVLQHHLEMAKQLPGAGGGGSP